MAEKQAAEQIEHFRRAYGRVRDQIAAAVVGQEAVVDQLLTCLFAGGHALLEGVPGLGKTLLVRSLGDALELSFRRIQFTPDLMPADITGTSIVSEGSHGSGPGFSFQAGPIFAQLVLADEINRATPKTQSALLEAMQERSVSAGGETRPMAEPFFVLATQNPIEQEGTYPLPEAQLDRFLFKLKVGAAGRDELHEILNRTTGARAPAIEPVLGAESVQQAQRLVRRVVIASHVQDYAVRCVLATHPDNDQTVPLAKRYVRLGASPRAAQALVLGAKVQALVAGRGHASVADVVKLLAPALRHRILLDFEGEAEGISAEDVIGEIRERVDVPDG